MTYYEILGIDRNASTDAIESAFRKVARQVHPDMNAGDGARAEARMKQLNEIRDTLTDPLLRAGYDERLRLEDEQTARAAGAARRRAAREEPADPRREDRAAPAAKADTRADARGGSSAGPRLVLVALGAGLVASAIAVSLPRAVSPLHGERQPPSGPAADPATSSSPPSPPAPFAPPPGDVPRANDAPPPARPLRARRRGVVHLGSSVDAVVRAFGAPDRVETGARAGDATFHYGKLRLEIENGRVTGGDAAVR